MINDNRDKEIRNLLKPEEWGKVISFLREYINIHESRNQSADNAMRYSGQNHLLIVFENMLTETKDKRKDNGNRPTNERNHTSNIY